MRFLIKWQKETVFTGILIQTLLFRYNLRKRKKEKERENGDRESIIIIAIQYNSVTTQRYGSHNNVSCMLSVE